FEEEIERNILTSLVICLFARKVYTRDIVLECLNAIGLPLSGEDLTKAGREILKLKYNIKKKLGFSLESAKIPARFFETPTANGKLEESTARFILEQFNHRIESLNG
ncbi:MAG TPA: aldehyde ferredoxin oxidoreductase C-terminal domain-containing protein, partial [Syntrophomonadaceae bacterium]|nr:aldehyde ferredoxin oxidoreductase C-terminal domain-containing protein [Syntrophomonadaceae bacterium]